MSSTTRPLRIATTQIAPPGLVARVSHIPLVETAIWAYEQGKTSSRVVNYGAEMVESSVNAILTPLINWLPVNQLDQFLCRQLDKLDQYRNPPTSSTGQSSSSISDDLKSKESAEKNVPRWLKVPGMKPDMAPVPVIPDWITGRCVYGHIVTDDHRDHFRLLHPEVEEWQSSDPDSLVSIASVLYHESGYDGATTKVYDQGQWHICLIHMDHRIYYPYRIADRRRSKTFMATLEKVLGITGEPKWYPCYSH